jgi:hypothetical protein
MWTTAVAATGALLVSLAVFGHGAGISPDSAGYIAAARSLLVDGRLVWYDGQPLVAQPPFYPVLLAGTAFLTQADPLQVAGPLNVVLYLSVIAAIIATVRFRFREEPRLAAFCTAAAVLSSPLCLVAVMAWSELLFILLVIGTSLQLDVLKSTHRKRAVIVLTLLSASACLTRYMGIAVVAWVAVSLLSSDPVGTKPNYRRAAAYVCAATLPLALWIIRNYVLSGTLFGLRAQSRFTLGHNLLQTVTTILSWYAPIAWTGRLLPLVVAGLAVMVLATTARNDSAIRPRLRPVAARDVGFLAFYLAFIVVVSTVSAHDEIDDRLLAPVGIHLAIAGAYGAAKVLHARGGRALGGLRLLAAGALVLGMIAWPAARTARMAWRIAQTGEGLSSDAWRQSETARYLSARQRDFEEVDIYSNAPDAVYFLSGLNAQWSPAATAYNSTEPGSDARQVPRAWPGTPRAVLVWFDRRTLGHLHSPQALERMATIEPIHRASDGTVYLVARTGRARANQE